MTSNFCVTDLAIGARRKRSGRICKTCVLSLVCLTCLQSSASSAHTTFRVHFAKTGAAWTERQSRPQNERAEPHLSRCRFSPSCRPRRCPGVTQRHPQATASQGASSQWRSQTASAWRPSQTMPSLWRCPRSCPSPASSRQPLLRGPRQVYLRISLQWMRRGKRCVLVLPCNSTVSG